MAAIPSKQIHTIRDTNKLNTVAAFVDELIAAANPSRSLLVAASNFHVFEPAHSTMHVVSGMDWHQSVAPRAKFDLILGDLPLAMNKISYEFLGNQLDTRRKWAAIPTSLQLLNADGIAAFLVEPSAFSSTEGTLFETALNSAGYFVNAIFEMPDQILRPETNLTPSLVLISKNKPRSLFVAKLIAEAQSRVVVNSFFAKTAADSLSSGMLIPNKNFRGFDQIRIRQQIEKLETQYKEYSEYFLIDIATEINYVRSGETLQEIENSVYIPRIGNSPVIDKISDATIKHHNYFQVVLGDKAINNYVCAFFKSDLGKLVLKSLTSGTIISHLNKRDLEQAAIALPSRKDQEQILSTQRKMYKLKQAITEFDAELALNPTSSSSITSLLENMLEVMGGLTEIDRIRNMIRQGESAKLEFKETLSLDVKKKTKEKYLEHSALKTVVAFLNSDGGTLLVGVNDNGSISGLRHEIDKLHKGASDKLLLHFKNLLKTRVGEEFYTFITTELVDTENDYILSVTCDQSRIPCYLDGAEFYVRTNPATDRLEGPKLVDYVRNHFDL